MEKYLTTCNQTLKSQYFASHFCQLPSNLHEHFSLEEWYWWLNEAYVEEGIISQPRKVLISGSTLQNGIFINPLLLFCLELCLVSKEIHRIVEYFPSKCFKSFLQSAVDARIQGDGNPNSSVVAETMKLLANSFYAYQIMHGSRHTVTKCLRNKKTHAANTSKLFKKLDQVKS